MSWKIPQELQHKLDINYIISMLRCRTNNGLRGQRRQEIQPARDKQATTVVKLIIVYSTNQLLETLGKRKQVSNVRTKVRKLWARSQLILGYGAQRYKEPGTAEVMAGYRNTKGDGWRISKDECLLWFTSCEIFDGHDVALLRGGSVRSECEVEKRVIDEVENR